MVFIKKIIKPVFFKKKPKPVQTERFQFGSVILERKLVQTGFFGLAQFFQFCLVFSQFGLVFFIWVRFDLVFSVSGL
jgi:hypothetical protein